MSANAPFQFLRPLIVLAAFISVLRLLFPVGALATHNGIEMTQPEVAGPGSPQIDGGDKQKPDNWPATLKYYLGDDFACTATVVGETAVITAAHCLDEQTKATIKLADGTSISLNCEAHPSFNSTSLTFDVAMCLITQKLPSSLPFESVNLDAQDLVPKRSLFLLGYGCRDVTTQAKSGQLYGGLSSIGVLPSHPGDHIKTKGGVVICPGDSGGAAYALADAGQPFGPRSIIGLNSGYWAHVRVSAIEPLSAAAEFIRSWAKRNKIMICGVDSGAKRCHDRV